MQISKAKVLICVLFLVSFLIPFSHITSSQELGIDANMIGSSPFVFVEGKFWIFSLGLGVGLGSPNTLDISYGNSQFDFALTLKIYPIELEDFSPYLGATNRFSFDGYLKESRTFGGVEFDFPAKNIPLSVFGSGDLVATDAEGFAGLGWHLGVKYKFSFQQ